jgi:hypothetical protein
MLSEGGHAVENVVPIHQSNVKDTIRDLSNKLLTRLGVSIPESAKLLGSAGKKGPDGKSGDIDIAVDLDLIMKKNNLSDENQLMSFVETKAKKFSPSVTVNKGTKIISVAWEIVNTNGEQENSYVQTDLMLVPAKVLDYSEFAYWSPHASESQYKGLYRTSLLITIAKVINMSVIERVKNKEGEEVPATWERLFMDLRTGLHQGKQTIKSDKTGALGKTKRTFDKFFVSSDRKEIIEMLLGKEATEKDTNSLESLWSFIHSDKFPYKSKLKEIENTYVQDLQDQKIQIPSLVQNNLKEDMLMEEGISKGTVHLSHLEDVVFEYGKRGVGIATNMIYGFLEKFKSDAVTTSNLTVSEKIDGSPAVFFGQMPDGKFFVSLWKSAFGGTQKICFDTRQIDKFYPPDDGGKGPVGDILKNMFITLKPAFNHPGYACQGDLLWSDEGGKKEAVINGKRVLTFKPNPSGILYSIPVDPKSTLYKNAKRARLGVAIHGIHKVFKTQDERIDKDKIENVGMIKEFADDLNKKPSIFSVHPFVDNLDVIKGQTDELKEIEDTLNHVNETNKAIDSHFDAEWTNSSNPYMKLFKSNVSKFLTHQIVSTGKVKTVFSAKDEADFIKTFQDKLKEYMSTQLDREIPEMKSLSGKQAKTKKYEEFYAWIQDEENLELMLKVFFGLHDIKILLVKLLDGVERKLGETFNVDRQNEFEMKAVKPEGYVFLSDGNMIKLVDRIEFTKNNLAGRGMLEEVQDLCDDSISSLSVSDFPEEVLDEDITSKVLEDVFSAMESLKTLNDGFNEKQMLEAANKMKDYSAVYVGRFQPPTLAHSENISKLAKLFKKVYVLVSQATNKTPKYILENPLTGEERVNLLKSDPKIRNNNNVIIETGQTYLAYGILGLNKDTGSTNEVELRKILGIPDDEKIVIALGKEDDRYFDLRSRNVFFDTNKNEAPSTKKHIGLYGIDLIQSKEFEGKKVSASHIRDAIINGDLETASQLMAGSDAHKDSTIETIRDRLLMAQKALPAKKVKREKVKESIERLSEELDDEKLGLDDAFDIVLDSLEE